MGATRAFIVRPFGTKEGIDFDRVERDLIAPALAACGIAGRTTGEITRQGNIREDMFRLLVISDLVIADVSIHNANVFYELGIRHGLCEQHTLLIRAKDSNDQYPFDLQTDRYLTYDANNPGADLGAFTRSLKSTLAASAKDSPVFQLLPKLTPHDRNALMVVPWDFQEEVQRASAGRRRGDLRLLAEEVQGFEWVTGGLRLIGEAQFKLKAFAGARETFEALRRTSVDDFLTNYRLGTIYQKLADSAVNADGKLDCITQSELAIRRALKRAELVDDDESAAAAAQRRSNLAEGKSLLGSNAKTRWLEDWKHLPQEARAAKALQSPHLGTSIDCYVEGFTSDLDSYYAGINALALLKVQIELAKAQPSVWSAGFDSDDEAASKLKERERRTARIAAVLELALGVDGAAARNGGKRDIWKEITRADLLFLTTDRAQRVSTAYGQALAGAAPFEIDAARRNVMLFKELGLSTEKVNLALEVMKAAAQEERAAPGRVVLFTGHMLDAPDRPKDKARFPRTPEAEATARAMIERALREEMAESGGVSLGIAGGACGSDILFHEACESLGIRTALLLALPTDAFQVESVNRGGPKWIERYRRLVARVAPRVLSESKELPHWLTDKAGYDIWQRNNLWMMFNALAEEASNRTLIGFYNRERDPDGPGGTAHLLAEATKRGFKPVELDARELLKT